MLRSSRVDVASTTGTQESPTISESVIIPSIESGSTQATTGTAKVILEWDEDTNTVTTSITTVNTPTPPTATLSTNYADGSYGKIIPYLVTTYKLKDTDKINPIFQFVSAKSSLYAAFATAYSKRMIGKDIKPTTKVSCDTYLVLKGIAAGWKLSYTGTPFAAYRAEAEKKGLVNGCKSGSYVTNKTL